VDIDDLRAHPDRLPTYLFHQRIRETPVPGGFICQAVRLTLEDGESVFAKSYPGGAPANFFQTEAAGLRWLAEAGGAPAPAVIAALPELLALAWVEPGEATPAAAERFGRELAATHRAGADAFGAPWPGFIGSLAQDNTRSAGGWPEWFATRRLEPYLRLAAERGALPSEDVRAVRAVLSRIDDLAAAPEPPARVLGDLWPGNVHWATDGRAWLVDPAAHGGHRETDLAQLALFGGAPHLDRILRAYDEAWPLADGWQARVPLHQLHLLLVHAALFGAGYRSAVMTAVASLR
jgi:fructosamine-3-kinase